MSSTPATPAPAAPDDPRAQRRATAKKWIKFLLRWTIAVVGIGYVILKTPLYDTVTAVHEQTGLPVKLTLAEEMPERAREAKVIDPATGQVTTISRDRLV